MHLRQRLRHPVNAPPDALRSRVIRSVCQPHRYIPRTQFLRDRYRFQQMIDCHASNSWIRIADRSEFVFLALEKVRIDRARANAVLRLQIENLPRVAYPSRQVPGHVQCKGRRRTGQRLNLRRVGKFLLNRCRRLCLQKLSKPCPGVGKPPRRQLNPQRVQRLGDLVLVRGQCPLLPIEISSQLKCGRKPCYCQKIDESKEELMGWRLVSCTTRTAKTK